MYHILLSLIAIGAPLDCEHTAELLENVSNNPNKTERLELTRVIIAHTDPACFPEDANADWRNGLFTLPEDKPMAQVTYRGVKYDTNDSRSNSKSNASLTYRGVKHDSKAVAV